MSPAKFLVTQLVDNDGDRIMDELLFQPPVGSKSEKQFEIIPISEEDRPPSEADCYSRFLPERTDDYTSENGIQQGNLQEEKRGEKAFQKAQRIRADLFKVRQT